MYAYDTLDKKFLSENTAQLKKPVQRYLEGKLDEDKFRNLRLRNGLYKELHAHMLRVAIPYGVLNSKQLHKLADVADKYDRNFGHFTTRQNIQYNWINLDDYTEILDDLATVEMHAVQTSGRVVRNIISDYLSGVAIDEVADTRPYCEALRQWFTLHPEFSWLGGKFKIAVSGSYSDRTPLKFHDLGYKLVLNEFGEKGFEVYAGGGLGASPFVAKQINSFLPEEELIGYTESVLRIYNRFGRRDNAKRKRIKFLVHELGGEEYARRVNADWEAHKEALDPEERYKLALTPEKINAFQKHFTLPITADPLAVSAIPENAEFATWKSQNTLPNKVAGYLSVVVSLATTGLAPGDLGSEQMRVLGDLCKQFSHNEARTTPRQSIILPYVHQSQIYELWQALKAANLAAPEHNTLAQVVCCPGGDYCSLAKTSSISVAKDIQNAFDNLDTLLSIGGITINVSGCENSCSQHHLADIGLLGLKKGEAPYYQITLAGTSHKDTRIGRKLGPSVHADNITRVVKQIVAVYLQKRQGQENFSTLFNRVGLAPFKEAVYGA